MNISVNVKSNKKYMKLEDIKIPGRLVSTPPKLDKVLDHHQDYINNGYLDPIIVNADDVIIDGYISYLIHKHYGREKVLVYRITVKAE